MARYSTQYQLAKDIDWFFMADNIPVHVASGGGLLPDTINSKESLRRLQHRINTLEPIWEASDLIYNESFLEGYAAYIRENMNLYSYEPENHATSPDVVAEFIEAYLQSFKEMAMRGFVSIDRTNIEDWTDNSYHLVCRPKDLTRLNHRRFEIPELQIYGDNRVILEGSDFNLFGLLGE